MTFQYEKPPVGKKLSAPEKGRLNKKNLDNYIAYLKETGQKFSENQHGDVNESEVAEKCGFLRQVFATNKNMAKTLTDAVKEIGTTNVAGRDPQESQAQEVILLRKQLNDAMRDVALLEEKNAGLSKQLSLKRKEIKRLTKKSEEDAESLEFMLETGRRFSL